MTVELHVYRRTFGPGRPTRAFFADGEGVIRGWATRYAAGWSAYVTSAYGLEQRQVGQGLETEDACREAVESALQ